MSVASSMVSLLMLSMRGVVREESPGRYTVSGILET